MSRGCRGMTPFTPAPRSPRPGARWAELPSGNDDPGRLPWPLAGRRVCGPGGRDRDEGQVYPMPPVRSGDIFPPSLANDTTDGENGGTGAPPDGSVLPQPKDYSMGWWPSGWDRFVRWGGRTRCREGGRSNGTILPFRIAGSCRRAADLGRHQRVRGGEVHETPHHECDRCRRGAAGLVLHDVWEGWPTECDHPGASSSRRAVGLGADQPGCGAATRKDLCRDRDGPGNWVPALGNQRGNER